MNYWPVLKPHFMSSKSDKTFGFHKNFLEANMYIPTYLDTYTLRSQSLSATPLCMVYKFETFLRLSSMRFFVENWHTKSQEHLLIRVGSCRMAFWTQYTSSISIQFYFSLEFILNGDGCDKRILLKLMFPYSCTHFFVTQIYLSEFMGN